MHALRTHAGKVPDGGRTHPRQVAELNQKIEEVLDERLGLRIDALARRRAAEEAAAAQRLERQRRARLDTMLAVIAAIGISGLGQIIQAGYDVKVLGSVWIATAIAMLATVIGVVVWLIAGRSHDHPEPAARPAPQVRPGPPRRTVRQHQTPSVPVAHQRSHPTDRSDHASA